MKFEYNKAEIEKVAREHNYTVNNVEKVLRLSFILDDLNTMPEFKGKLLLKGGTAINLVAFDKLRRLSVDLDLILPKIFLKLKCRKNVKRSMRL